VDGFLTIQVLNGRVQIKTPDGDIEAEERQIITFHPGVHHSVKALSNACLLLTNHLKFIVNNVDGVKP
jgi:quercetin dioxygenase-like cupin family protein